MGTIGATIVALWFGLKAIRDIEKNQPDLIDEAVHRERIEILKITNVGLGTAKKVNLRLESITVNGTEVFHEEETNVKVVPLGNLQNGESKLVRVFESQPSGVRLMNFGSNLLNRPCGIRVSFRVTGDNFPAKKIHYLLNAGEYNEDNTDWLLIDVSKVRI